MTIPTDAEAWEMWLAQPLTGHAPKSVGEFTRKAIAKWGQPQAVASGEPDNAFPLTGKVYKRGAEWVLEISGTINDCNFTCRHTKPGHLRPEDVAGLPLIYTAPPPQAVQKPLPTDVELMKIISKAVRGLTMHRNGTTSIRIAKAVLEEYGYLYPPPKKDAETL